MTLPPPFVMPATGRDTNSINLDYIRAQINHNRDEDSKHSHQFENLQNHYSPAMIQYYDVICMGYEESASLMANEIQFSMATGSYLDLGCGTGMTTEACVKRLTEQSPQISQMNVLVVDGLQAMTAAAVARMSPWLTTRAVNEVRCMVNDVFGRLEYLQDQGPFQLITAQRLLVGCSIETRAQQLQQWAAFLHEDGKLLVDIPHPRRHPSALFIGPRLVAGSAGHARIQKCIQVCDQAVFEECRTYAKELARSAGLQVLNAMPAQLPPTIEDGRPTMTLWLNNTCAATVRNSLGLDEHRWFDRRWVGDAVQYYMSNGFAAQVDLAAVVVLLGRATELENDPVYPAPPPDANTTKYDIDPSLTGKERAKAKKNAAKRLKKEAKRADGASTQVGGSVGGGGEEIERVP